MIHRQVFLPVYLPALLLGIPAQASFVLLPLYVLEQGGSVAQASAVVGVHGIGMMLMDIPAGMLASRYGEKFVMVLATLLIASAYLGYALAEALNWFYVIALLGGAGSSTFLLGRMAYISARIEGGERGRVIAMIAGSLRVSALVGPLAGAALATAAGYAVSFVCGALSVAAGLICVLWFADHRPATQGELNWRGFGTLIVQQRRVFATAGIAAVIFMLMRASRTVLLPLLGAALALDANAIGMVVSLSAAVDVLMFYPAGVLMDRYGRRATAVPSAILFTLVMAGMAVVDSHALLLIFGVALGLTNGLSTGIVMTLGTDLAPPLQRGEFLGLWRLLTDFGTAAGPLVISAVVLVAPLGAAALCISAVGAAGSFIIYRYVEETLVR